MTTPGTSTKTPAKILIFAGSARTASLNKRLAEAMAKLAISEGADTTLVDLADYDAPIYSGDIEADSGIPRTIQDLKALMQQHDGFIIATPEYNGHVPPLLVNLFSWASRSASDEKGMVAFTGKHAAIVAASPGRLGGIRVIPRLRDMLAELGVTVIPGFVTVPQAMSAFNDDGSLKEPATKSAVALVERLINACK